MNSSDVVSLISTRSGYIRRDFGVRSLSLFGSVARGEGKESSDADFLVEFEGAATFDRYMGLKLYLEDILGCRVDLVTSKGVRGFLRRSLEQEAIRVA